MSSGGRLAGMEHSPVMTFEEWLVRKRDEDSPHGDLARDMANARVKYVGGTAATSALEDAQKAYRRYATRKARQQ
jgi:hypothetical protein